MNINFELIAEPECGIAVDSSSTEYATGTDIYTKGNFSKDQCVVLNVLHKADPQPKEGCQKSKYTYEIQGDVITECAFLNHNDPTEVTHHKFKDGDGLYYIDHFIIPTTEWFNTTYQAMHEYYTGIYCYDEATGALVFYDASNADPIIVTEPIHEVMLDLFYDTDGNELYHDISVLHTRSLTLCTCGLHECYYHLAMQLLGSLGPCDMKVDSDLIYKRDMVWMGINVIDYLLDKGDPYTASGILRKLEECNGVCSKFLGHKPFKDCGCHR